MLFLYRNRNSIAHVGLCRLQIMSWAIILFRYETFISFLSFCQKDHSFWLQGLFTPWYLFSSTYIWYIPIPLGAFSSVLFILSSWQFSMWEWEWGEDLSSQTQIRKRTLKPNQITDLDEEKIGATPILDLILSIDIFLIIYQIFTFSKVSSHNLTPFAFDTSFALAYIFIKFQHCFANFPLCAEAR